MLPMSCALACFLMNSPCTPESLFSAVPVLELGLCDWHVWVDTCVLQDTRDYKIWSASYSK